jgi:hypothetical protein
LISFKWSILNSAHWHFVLIWLLTLESFSQQ